MGRPSRRWTSRPIDIWPPLRLARLRHERGSVVVVLPAGVSQGGGLRSDIGLDVHRQLRGGGDPGPGRASSSARRPLRRNRAGAASLRRTLGRRTKWCSRPRSTPGPSSTWLPTAGRVVVSNPLRTRAIASPRSRRTKSTPPVLAQLLAADFLPEVWTPDAGDARIAGAPRSRTEPPAPAAHPAPQPGPGHPPSQPPGLSLQRRLREGGCDGWQTRRCRRRSAASWRARCRRWTRRGRGRHCGHGGRRGQRWGTSVCSV